MTEALLSDGLGNEVKSEPSNIHESAAPVKQPLIGIQGLPPFGSPFSCGQLALNSSKLRRSRPREERGTGGNISSPSRGHEHLQQGRPNQYHPGTGLADL